jgi:hypothetical protein
MNDSNFGKSIANYLNRGVADMDSRVAARLKVAREKALEQVHAPEAVLAGSLTTSSGWGGYFTQHPRMLFGALLLLAAVMAMLSLWRNQEKTGDSPIDAQILASDVPLHAFTKGDLTEWLEDSSR